MKVFGSQSQRFDGIVQVIGQCRPPVWKLIDPDSDILRAIKQTSQQTTTIVRVYTGAPTVDDKAQHPDPERYGVEYAEKVYARVSDPAHMDYLESENEPNDHYNDLTEFIKRLNAFLVGFSRRAKQLGFRPLGPNFSTGYPEVYVPGSDYMLWPNAWQGLTDGLRALRDAGGALALHEYDAPDLFRLWSDTKQRGYLVGRHKAVYASLPDDLQTLPLYLTEFEIDFLVQQIEGGFWHDRNEQAPQWMCDQMREAWRRVYATTPQLKGICFFLWGRNDPKWEEYDQRRTDDSARAFTQFMAEELTGSSPPIPPPTGEKPMEPTAAQTVATVPYLVKASLQEKYGPGGLGQSLYGEYGAVGDGNEEWRAWIFLRGGLKVKTGNYAADFSGVKLFHPRTGEAMNDPLPWPTSGSGTPPVIPPVPNPDPGNMLPYKFPNALTMIGAVGEQGQPVSGQSFYRITGAAVRQGISAFMVVTLIGKNGVPVVGVKVINLFPDGNGEVQQTDGSGNVRFQFGASSAFTQPGTGPFTVFVADDSAYKDSDSIPKRVVWQSRLSDIVHSLGDFQGQHTEINIQLVEQP